LTSEGQSRPGLVDGADLRELADVRVVVWNFASREVDGEEEAVGVDVEDSLALELDVRSASRGTAKTTSVALLWSRSHGGGTTSSVASSRRRPAALSVRAGNGAVAGADSSVVGPVGVAGAAGFRSFHERRASRGKDSVAEKSRGRLMRPSSWSTME